MDPNANLMEIRAILVRTDGNYDTAERLAELVRALDGWVTTGGVLPDAWQPAPRAAARPVIGSPEVCWREAYALASRLEAGAKDRVEAAPDAQAAALGPQLASTFLRLNAELMEGGPLPTAWSHRHLLALQADSPDDLVRRAERLLRFKYKHVICLDADDSLLRHATDVHAADYWKDVRDAADELEAWVKDQLAQGVRGEPLREALLEQQHALVDGHGRVMYTVAAQETLLFSHHDGAAVEEGLVEARSFTGGIPWSQLAYGAFRADVLDELDQRGKDVNTPWNWLDAEEDEEEDAEDGDGEKELEGAGASTTVTCSRCQKPCAATAAHRHQGVYIGDECCWDERLKASE